MAVDNSFVNTTFHSIRMLSPREHSRGSKYPNSLAKRNSAQLNSSSFFGKSKKSPYMGMQLRPNEMIQPKMPEIEISAIEKATIAEREFLEYELPPLISNFGATIDRTNSLVKDYKRHSMIKTEIFKEISNFLNQKSPDLEITCLKVHLKFIVIGTLTGEVIIFDHFENLHMKISAQLGAITALEFSSDGNFLLVGDSLGNILIWDQSNQRELKTLRSYMSDIVINLKFISCDNQITFTSIDRNGIGYLNSLSKFLFSYSVSKKEFIDGSHGQITSFEINKANADFQHPADSFELYSLATLDYVTFIDS